MVYDPVLDQTQRKTQTKMSFEVVKMVHKYNTCILLMIFNDKGTNNEYICKTVDVIVDSTHFHSNQELNKQDF